MVDFNAEDIDLYLPRNLSNDKDYHLKYSATNLYEELKRLRQQSSVESSMDPNECTESPCTNGAVNGATGSDDAAKFFLPTGAHAAKDKPLPPVLADSPLESPDMANCYNRNSDLSSYLKDLTLAPPEAGSPNDVATPDTVFSDDYTLTDHGDESDVAGRRGISKDNSFASDSSAFSDPLLTPTEESRALKEDVIPKTQNGAIQRKEKPGKLVLPRNPVDLKQWVDTPSTAQTTSPAPAPVQAPQNTDEALDSTTFYEDSREFDFLRAEPVKRSTSLKTTKTPPGTPSRKKAVRFADALGLDLEVVRQIVNIDEPPKVPASALFDLKVGMEEERKTEGIRYLSTSFAQPGASPTFYQRVQGQKVLLENCVVDDKQSTIMGTIRVLNISYHKKVTVRYSVNNWLTHTDMPASYVQNSNDGPTDRFSFSLCVPNYFGVGSRLQFCLKYSGGTEDFWDSNYGGNYIVECYAKASPVGDKYAWDLI